MILKEYYLSDPANLDRALIDTGLALDELEALVGRFTARSQWAGGLRGKVVLKMSAKGLKTEIRHHFKTNLLYWSVYHDHPDFI